MLSHIHRTFNKNAQPHNHAGEKVHSAKIFNRNYSVTWSGAGRHAGWNESGMEREEIYMIIALSDFMNKFKEIADKNSSKFHNRFRQLTTA